MKIRRTIALLTALAMIAALVPAMALTAYADESADYLIMADGKTVYKLASANLLADGSFETDAWAEQLTVGKNYGNAGKEYTSPMSEHVGGSSPVWARSRLTALAEDGIWALRLVSDKSSTGNGITDANKPASIKHYIVNESSESKMYYARFYAKSGSGSSSLTFALSAVNDTDDGSSGRSVTLNDKSWTQADGIVTVRPGENMLLNIYSIAVGTYLDGFEIFEVYRDSACSKFTKCLEKWNFDAQHPNGEVISQSFMLPTSAGDAKVTWASSRPDVLRADIRKGEKPMAVYTAPNEDTEVVLTATISYEEFNVTREYRLVAKGIADDVRAKLLASVPYGIDRTVRLPSTLEGYGGSVVRWSSSAPEVVSDTGVYKDPGYQVELTLTATFTWGDAVIVYPVKAVAGIKSSLISNGSFDLARDLDNGTKEIFGWTVGVEGVNSRNGGTQPMTTANFDLVQEQEVDENGRAYTNQFIVSKGHGSLDSPNSIRKYVALTPGKRYRLSYKYRYMGTGVSEDFYMGAYLVGSNGTEVAKDPTSSFTSEFGEIYYKDGTQWASSAVTAEDGWQTVETILSPQEYNSYLLIAAKWLNRNTQTDGSTQNTDGRWAFDDFVLEEFDAGYTADVTIEYYPYGDEAFALKEPRVQANVYGDSVYTATAEDKRDITVAGRTYRYDPNVSTDSVKVTEDGENVIKLYFRVLQLTDVTVNYEFFDKNGDPVDIGMATSTIQAYKYFENEIPGSAIGGKVGVITVNGRQYICDNPDDKIVPGDDPEQNKITLVFSELNNLIPNGFFSNGLSGWTNRKVSAGQPSGGSIAMDSELGVNALTIATGGRDADNAIGTVWNVTKGKRYHLSFWVSGGKPEENNYVYNQITDARKHFKDDDANSSYDASGNTILAYGRDMVGNVWTKMETDFVAQTDMLFFVSGWSNGEMKFAGFILTENSGDFTTDVTVNYLDRETGAALKAPRTVTGLEGFNDGSISYSATSDDKNDITYNGQTYTYDQSSRDTVNLGPSNNVINLYFVVSKAVSATDIVVDVEAGQQTYNLPSQVDVLYNSGQTKKVAVTWGERPELEPGDIVEIAGEADGVPVKATVRKFYAGDVRLPDDYADYQWIGSGTRKYAVALDAANIVTNPQFLEDANGWTNRRPVDQDTSIANATFTEEAGINGKIMNISTGGRAAANSIGTVWPVTSGKTYYLSFQVGGGKPDGNNEKYNVVSDARQSVTDGGTTGWDASGNTLIAYGHDMTANKWNLMETVFTATTDMVFFVSGWVNNIKLADFKLYEIVDQNKYFDSEASPLAVKIDVDLNGVVVDTIYVDKDGEVPNLSSKYPDCSIDDSNVDTSVPNAGTIYVVDPTKSTTLNISNGRAVLGAVGENVVGVVVIVQYDANGRELAVNTYDVDVKDGEFKSIDFSLSGGVKSIKGMLLDSKNNIRPLLRSVVYNNF